jgi:hypothetical protein
MCCAGRPFEAEASVSTQIPLGVKSVTRLGDLTRW